MYQAEIMKKFNGPGHLPGIGVNFIKEFIAHQYRHGSYTLTPQLEDVLCRVIKGGCMYGKMPAVEPGFEKFGEC
jgi:hypothetical protein